MVLDAFCGFIWSLLAVRSEYGMLDGGTRFHVISHLIRETVSCGRSMLATSLAGRDDSSETGSSKDIGAVQNLIQKDRILAAEKLIHLFRSLIDERGPWSTNPFPNCDPPAGASCKDVVVPSGEIKLGSGLPIPEQMKQITDKVSSKLSESDSESSSQKVLNSEEIPDHQSELVKDVPFSKDPVQERKESSSTEVEGGEVLMSIPCVLITPKRKLFGQLAVMRSALHFIGDFLVEGTAGFSIFKNFDCTSNLESGKQEHLAGIQKQKVLKLLVHLTSYSEKHNSLDTVDQQPKNVKCHRRWNLSKVKAVHWNRYLIRYTATEIFFSNSVAPVFFNFASQQRAKDVQSLKILQSTLTP